MPRPPSTEPRVRLNLEIPIQVRERIDRIKGLIEADSSTEVIRRAVSLYELLLTLKGQVVIRLPDGREQDVLSIRDASRSRPS